RSPDRASGYAESGGFHDRDTNGPPMVYDVVMAPGRTFNLGGDISLADYFDIAKQVEARYGKKTGSGFVQSGPFMVDPPIKTVDDLGRLAARHGATQLPA